MDDLRTFQIMQMLVGLRNVWTKSSTTLDPGSIFPSLKDLELRDDEGDEVDPELAYQALYQAMNKLG